MQEVFEDFSDKDVLIRVSAGASPYRGRRAEAPVPEKSEDRGQRTEVRGRRTEDGGQRAEIRGRRTEDGDKWSCFEAKTSLSQAFGFVYTFNMSTVQEIEAAISRL